MKRLVLISSLVLGLSNIAHAANAKRGGELFAKCIECHGEKGLGKKEKDAPRISGQHDWYIETSIKSFQDGTRNNPVMLPYIKNLTDEDIKDLAAHISTL